jgi:hypothetical protein
VLYCAWDPAAVYAGGPSVLGGRRVRQCGLGLVVLGAAGVAPGGTVPGVAAATGGVGAAGAAAVGAGDNGMGCTGAGDMGMGVAVAGAGAALGGATGAGAEAGGMPAADAWPAGGGGGGGTCSGGSGARPALAPNHAGKALARGGGTIVASAADWRAAALGG